MTDYTLQRERMCLSWSVVYTGHSINKRMNNRKGQRCNTKPKLKVSSIHLGQEG